MSITGIKHLVKCNCILPQMKRLKNPPFHQFPVFSIIDENDEVKEKYAQCNNCGIIHRVYEISKSEILKNKEHMKSITNVEEIKCMLHQNLVSMLEMNDADIATWEQVQFIIENEDWNSYITLNIDVEGDKTHLKMLKIISPVTFKLYNEVRIEHVLQ